MLRRPEKFEEVIGHQKTVSFMRERVNTRTFPHFVMISGEEGLGKTTLAKLIAMALNCSDKFKPCYECKNCREITDKVIRQNKDTNSVVTFKMSKDGGEAAALEVISSFNTSFLKEGQKKVIIMDECHGMNSKAQDSLLQDTEYIPEDVYLIMLTSEDTLLKKQLTSRAVPFHLKRLAPSDMSHLLQLEASRRGLNIQAEKAAFDLIISYSENKARKALKVLEAMGENSEISLESIKDFVDFLDVRSIVPIISSLSGSVIIGINAVQSLSTDESTARYLVEILAEAVKVSMGSKSFKFSSEDSRLLRESVEGVETGRLVKFLYEVANLGNNFSKNSLMAAYLKCHPSLGQLEKHNPEVLREEVNEKFALSPEEGLPRNYKEVAPSLSQLLLNGKDLGDS